MTLNIFLTNIVLISLRLWVTLQMFWKAVLSDFLLYQNRRWVTLHFLWANSWHIFLSPKASKWCCTYYGRQSHHIFSMAKACKWQCPFFEHQSHQSFSVTNSLWAALYILLKGSPMIHLLFDQQLVSAWHVLLQESFHIFCYDQQQVSAIFIKAVLPYLCYDW